MLRSRVLRSVAPIAVAVATISCGDFTGTTSPRAATHARLSAPTRTVGASFAYLSEDVRAKAVRWGSSHTKTDESVSALVGPMGASLSLPGSDFTIRIPAGAVSAPTRITVTSNGGEYVEYDMQPHGLRFLKPVIVIQELSNTASYGIGEGNAIRSAYLSDKNERIEADDSASPTELQASTTVFYGAQPVAETHIWYLNHFSRYILISGVWVVSHE